MEREGEETSAVSTAFHCHIDISFYLLFPITRHYDGIITLKFDFIIIVHLFTSYSHLLAEEAMFNCDNTRSAGPNNNNNEVCRRRGLDGHSAAAVQIDHIEEDRALTTDDRGEEEGG